MQMGEWAKCEYMHMLDKLKGDASRLLITNMDAKSQPWITDAVTARGYNNGSKYTSTRNHPVCSLPPLAAACLLSREVDSNSWPALTDGVWLQWLSAMLPRSISG